MKKILLSLFIVSFYLAPNFAEIDYETCISISTQSPGNQVDYTVTTRNRGWTGASVPTTTRDRSTAGEFLETVPPLAPNQAHSYSRSAPCNSTGEAVLIRAEADSNDAIQEWTEDNGDGRTVRCNMGIPRLVASGQAEPGGHLPGQPFNITVTTSNTGTAAAGESVTTAGFQDAYYVTYVPVIALGAGGSDSFTFQTSCVRGRSWPVSFNGQADIGKQVEEDYECFEYWSASYNCTGYPLYNDSAKNLSDLVINSIRLVRLYDNGGQDEGAIYELETKNIGRMIAGPSVTYVSTPEMDVELNISIPALAPNESHFDNASTPWLVPWSHARRELFATADAYNNVSEINEANNFAHFFLPGSPSTGPDLSASAVVPQGQVPVGEPFNIAVMTHNNCGLLCTTGSSITNAMFGNASVDIAVPPILPGGTDVQQAELGCLEEGNMELMVTADFRNNVSFEGDGNNHHRYFVSCAANATNQTLPDLAILPFYISGQHGNGTEVVYEVNVGTRNNGGADAGESNTGIFLHGNRILTLPQPPLCADCPPHMDIFELACGAQSGVVYARADADLGVEEGDEGNNERLLILPACPPPPAPDLTVTFLGVPSTMHIGTLYTGSVVTRNNGPGQAPQTVTRVSLGNIEVNSGVPPLLANESFMGNFNVQCQQVGSFFASAWADALNNVQETDEGNNGGGVVSVTCIQGDARRNTTPAPQISSLPGYKGVSPADGSPAQDEKRSGGILNYIGNAFESIFSMLIGKK